LKAWADRGIKESTSDPGSGTVVRWGSDDSGTIFSRIDILRAVREDERYSTVPDVREILPRLPGWRKVVRVLEAIDIVDAGIDPADAAPEHRRHVQNERPRPYTQRVTKPGSGAERWNSEPLPDHAAHDSERNDRPADRYDAEPDSSRGLERVRECADRAVSSAHDRQADGQRSRHRNAA
jgi:hypothetical protein